MALVVSGCAQPAFLVHDSQALRAEVVAARAAAPDGTRVGYWLGDEHGTTVASEAPHLTLATASAIKTAYLIEWFAEFETTLDAPMPGVLAIVGDPDHPAVAHFDRGVQQEIAATLGTATVRQIGWAMIRSRLGPDGPPVSNAVYNAAANVVTAGLGGPAALTHRIHERFPDARDLHVRRYMLAARDVTGDNTASAAGLGQILAHVARSDVPGLAPETVTAVQTVLLAGELGAWGPHFFKSGALNSLPQCRILSGYVTGNDATKVYAVMIEGCPTADSPTSAAALMQLARTVRSSLLTAASR